MEIIIGGSGWLRKSICLGGMMGLTIGVEKLKTSQDHRKLLGRCPYAMTLFVFTFQLILFSDFNEP